MKILLLTIALSLFIPSGEAISQEEANPEAYGNRQDIKLGTFNDPEMDKSGHRRPRTDSEWILSVSVLTFGLVIMCIEAFLIKTNNLTTEVTFRLLVVTLIIIGTLFLITAGYSNDQIAAATGLLGTIAGYILGRIANNSGSS